MATQFPDLSPSGRQYTAAEWPTNSLDSQSGTTTRRLWGDEPARASLTLTFANIADDATASIMQCHYDAKGACDEIDFDPATMGSASGLCDTDLKNLVWLDDFANSDHHWHFVERDGVSVQSTGLGLSTVTCKFRSELPGS